VGSGDVIGGPITKLSLGQLGVSPTVVTTSDTPIHVDPLAPVKQVTTGDTHTCVLTTTGEVVCWGDNQNAQVNKAITDASALPTQIQVLPPAIAIDGGAFHTCAVTADHDVWCWGLLGANTYAPFKIEGLSDVVSVSAGLDATCVLHEDASVSCFGDNRFGQLGNDNAVDVLGDDPDFHAPVRATWPPL
jgi:alpha-tubulin suppressor-like RCC1 family protein